MKIAFNNPITVGDIGNQKTITSLQLKSLSFNLAGPKGAPNVLVSLVLTDPVSGYDAYFQYEDSIATAAYFNSVEALQLNGAPWINTLVQRLQADGKLPAGIIS